MDQQISWKLLARYFAGELNREKHAEITSWIKADPKREAQVDKLYKIWRESGELPYRVDEEAAWKSLSRDMDELDNAPYNVRQQNGGAESKISVLHKITNRSADHTARRVIMTAAAAILLVVGLFAYYGSLNKSGEPDIGIRELVAGEGERGTYILNDSTRIILHAGSRLEIPLNFNISKRELYLEGEAYFEVTHNPDKPFVVRSRNAYTRVLGTKFLVQAWSEKDDVDRVEVVVSEGKVAFGNNSTDDTAKPEEAIVSRNQKGVLSGSDRPVVTDNADLEWYLGWTEDRMVFDNRPLSDIIPRLERWYDVTITTADQQIASKTLTAEIDVSQSMGEVMRNIALSLDLNMEREDRVVRFSRRGENVNGK
ncbi:FecR family protein [Fodinibius roseus]|uniref:FecR family protein n=1 Tax=Fodinibius roseus TaxID=1194090 RepID=A0A1M5JKR0_9BACT|nr:FecR domain-containing protein [Fodinibius roseus]SHG40995.1 FecR family protein [Fodinibius roseus]